MTSKVLWDDKGSTEEVISPAVDSGVERPGDEEFGGSAERRRIERKLLWKLDCRMSIMIVIYILNYVSFPLSCRRTCFECLADRPKQCGVSPRILTSQ